RLERVAPGALPLAAVAHAVAELVLVRVLHRPLEVDGAGGLGGLGARREQPGLERVPIAASAALRLDAGHDRARVVGHEVETQPRDDRAGLARPPGGELDVSPRRARDLAGRGERVRPGAPGRV